MPDISQREPLPIESARKEILDSQKSNSEAYDRAILTLSSGFLAISISFFRNAIQNHQIIGSFLLVTSWILFTFAIIGTIISFMIAQRTARYKIDHLLEFYENPDKQQSINDNIVERIKIEDFSNTLSGIVFIVAVLTTVLFFSINLHEEMIVPIEKTSQQTELKKSMPSNTFQRPIAKPVPTTPEKGGMQSSESPKNTENSNSKK